MIKFKHTDNFINQISYEARYYYPGCSGCEGDGADMCRCCEIESVKFDNKCYHTATNIIEDYSDSSLERKVLETAAFKQLTSCSLENMFSAYWSWGYYGEEMEAINPTKHFEDYVSSLNGMSDVELLHYVLTLEYGKLTDTVKSITNFSLESVSLKKIKTPPGYKKTKQRLKNLSFFKNKYRNLYVGNNKYCQKKRLLLAPLCVKHGNEYRLVDGCHRFFEAEQTKNPKILKIPVLVMK